MKLGALCLAGVMVASTFICGCGAVRYPSYYALSTPAPIARGATTSPLLPSVAVRQFDAPPFLRSGPIDGHTAPEWVVTGSIEHLEEVEQGKRGSTDVRITADLTDFRTGEILWRSEVSGDAAVERGSVFGVVSQLSLGLGSRVHDLAFPMQDHARSLQPRTSLPTQPNSSNVP